MDQARKTKLEAGGVNVNSALERFMGNEAMAERYWQKFLDEKSYATLRTAIARERSGDGRNGGAYAEERMRHSRL